ncbi:hypothetical protein F4776DRAFT_639054 [Hypoxylon sp. NC0597]|nr:hypothetical protein F4776DRAFT_639054 [Hypoxylon sp. NC0597]
MAEAVGLASAAVGFTSLAIQLGSGAARLRATYKQSKELRHIIRLMTEDLDFISQFLPELGKLVEENPIESPMIVGHCIQRSQALHERIEQLDKRFAGASNNGQLAKKAKDLLNYHRIHDDIEELHRAILNTKTDLCMALTFTQGLQHRRFASMLLPPVDHQEAECHTSQAAKGKDKDLTPSGKEDATLVESDRSLRQKPRSCQVKHCSCSCHIRGSVTRRFWSLNYTPLSMILQRCDNAKCTSRRHQISFRLAFTQMGLPWAITLGLEMAAEAGKYSIGPTLETERIVRYTSTGFKLLWELRTDQISGSDAIRGFRELWKKDPHMVYHVNPAGRGYIEELVLSPASATLLDSCLDLLELFTQEFNMRLGLDSLELLYKSASWIGEAPHLYLLDTLLDFGLDPIDLPSPHWKRWPRPCSPDWMIPAGAPDPFFLKYMSKLVSKAPDFGTSSALQTAILTGDRRKARNLIRTSNNLENEINFLGQSPLHIAVLNDWAVAPLLDAGHDPNARDFHGITPLMYAAGMGKLEVVKLLIDHNAHILLQDYLWHRTFIHYAFTRGHWSLVTDAIVHIRTIYQGVRDCEQVVSHLAEIALVSRLAYWPRSEHKLPDFINLLSLVDTVNFRLTINEARNGTLLHYTSNLDEARASISHGFTLFNAEDSNGNTPIMNERMLGDPDFVRTLLDVGADANHRNKTGETLLSRLFTKLHHSSGSDIVKYVPGIIDSIMLLLKGGGRIMDRDLCTCACSPNGCLPTRSSAVRFKYRRYFGTESPLWTFESLILLEECHLVQEAKETIISFIRRCKFEDLKMIHTCCDQGRSWFDQLMQSDSTKENQADTQKQAMELNTSKLNTLNERMDQLSDLTYEELKSIWLQEIKLSHDSEVSAQKLQIKVRPKSPKASQFSIDIKKDEFTWITNYDIEELIPNVERSIARYLLSLERLFLSTSVKGIDSCVYLARHHHRLIWTFQLLDAMGISIQDIIKEIEQMPRRYGANITLLTTPELNGFIQRLQTWATEHISAPNLTSGIHPND